MYDQQAAERAFNELREAQAELAAAKSAMATARVRFRKAAREADKYTKAILAAEEARARAAEDQCR